MEAATDALGARGEAAAVDIQRMYRGHRVRHPRVAQLQHEDKHAKAATVIQRHARGRQARRRIDQQHAAATQVQRHVRGRQSRWHQRQRHQAAVVVQRHARGHLTRVDSAKRQEAATHLQRHARGHLARRDMDAKRAAATVVQRHARGHLDREHLRQQQVAATTVQRHIRGHLVRAASTDKRGATDAPRAEQPAPTDASPDAAAATGTLAEHDAATRIQAHVRGRQARAGMQQRQQAATTVQRHIRGHLVRKVDGTGQASSLQSQIQRTGATTSAATASDIVFDGTWTEDTHGSAATTIQRHLRGSHGRRQVSQLRAELALQDSVTRDDDGLVAVDGFFGPGTPGPTTPGGRPISSTSSTERAGVAQAAFAELIDDTASFSSPASRASAAAQAEHDVARGLPDILEATEGEGATTGMVASLEATAEGGPAATSAAEATANDIAASLEALESQHSAATDVQRTYRGYATRKVLHKRQDSARDIQRIYRGHAARLDIQRRHQGAAELQRVFRGHRVRKSLDPMGSSAKVQAAVGANRRASGYAGDVAKEQDSEEVKQELNGLSGDLLRLVRRMVDDKVSVELETRDAELRRLRTEVDAMKIKSARFQHAASNGAIALDPNAQVLGETKAPHRVPAMDASSPTASPAALSKSGSRRLERSGSSKAKLTRKGSRRRRRGKRGGVDDPSGNKCSVRYPQCRTTVYVPDDALGFVDKRRPREEWGASVDARALGTRAAPQSQLELEYVHGYNGSLTLPTAVGDFRTYANNIVTLASGEVVFPAAATCVVFNVSYNQQRFFSGHTGPVTCVAMHPGGRIVASGQVGHNPPICIWDAAPVAERDIAAGGRLPRPRHIANLMKHTVGVSDLAFSPDGALLASVGGDSHHTVCVWDWQTGLLLASASGSSMSVLTIRWNPVQYFGVNDVANLDEASYCLVTCGVGHVKFWTLHRPVDTAGSTAELDMNLSSHRRRWKLHGSRGNFSRSAEVQDAICLQFIHAGKGLGAGSGAGAGATRTPRTRKHRMGGFGSGASLAHSASASSLGPSAKARLGASGNLSHTSPDGGMLGSPVRGHSRDLWVGRIASNRNKAKAKAEAAAAAAAGTPRSSPYARSGRPLGPSLSGTSDDGGSAPALRSAWCVSGMVRGDVYVWHQPPLSQLSQQKRNIASRHPASSCPWHQGARIIAVMKGVHSGPVLCMSRHSSGLVASGGQDAVLHVWRLTRDSKSSRLGYSRHTTASLPGTASSRGSRVRSISWAKNGRGVIVGTTGHDVSYMDLPREPGAVSSGNGPTVSTVRRLIVPHTGSVDALVSHPNLPFYATAGTNRLVRLWNAETRECVLTHRVKERVLSMAFHPDGMTLALGVDTAEVVVIRMERLPRVLPTSTTQKHVWEGNQAEHRRSGVTVVTRFPLASAPFAGSSRNVGSGESTDRDHAVGGAAWNGRSAEPALDLKYSPNGAALAVGSRDCNLHVYDVEQGYRLRGMCRGHRAQIMSLDWSVDSTRLRSCDGVHQLLFWSATKCTQVASAYRMRNTRWATAECTLGWAVQGVWGDTGDDSAVSAVARSTDGTLLASSDDCNNVRLFRYPCLQGAQYSAGHGHMSQVSRIQWTHDDRRVLTIAGVDPSVFQWKHVAGTHHMPRL